MLLQSAVSFVAADGFGVIQLWTFTLTCWMAFGVLYLNDACLQDGPGWRELQGCQDSRVSLVDVALGVTLGGQDPVALQGAMDYPAIPAHLEETVFQERQVINSS